MALEVDHDLATPFLGAAVFFFLFGADFFAAEDFDASFFIFLASNNFQLFDLFIQPVKALE